MHFERGQDYPRAIKYLNQAAHNAMRRQAAHEAVALLSRSLTLLNALPDSPGRAENELALLVAMGVPLLMTKGYAAQEVERTYARAREICGELGESPQLLPALAGLFRFYFVRADFQPARAIADQILRLAEHTRDRVVSLVAHSLLGAILLSVGEFDAARKHNERGIALYDSREHSFMLPLYGDDPAVTCHCFLGLCLWYLGYPDQALASVQKALAVAKQIGSPYCETFALDFVSWLQILRRDEPAAQASVDALMRIAPDQGFQFLWADSQTLQGWILAAQGKAADGLQRMHPAIAAYQATGALMSKPSHLMLLAKAYAQAGQIDDALATLAEGRTVIDRTGERTYDSELDRLKGELLLHRSPRSGRKRQVASDAAAEAEACFQRAIEVSRRQGAKSLELRAATSLSRLWQRQGKRQQAQQLLGEIYGWFNEGFDTADLQDAHALLIELA